MPIILYHTNPCSHTPAIRRVLSHLGVDSHFSVLTPEKLAEVEGAVYQASPILVDDGKVLEDWRLIVRHLDERYGDGQLTAIDPMTRSELFDLCDEIDRGLLRAAVPLLLPDSGSLSKTMLKPLLGSKSASVSGKSDTLRAEIISTAARISTDTRLTRQEFKLAALLYQGALEFIRGDSEIAAKLPT